MSIPLQHLECDIRSWLQEHGGIASDYTVQRINQSYPRIQQILTESGGVSFTAALDIGCGAGFDAFALGVHFDQVLAIDSSEAAIEEARSIAREAGVSNVHFECVDALGYVPSTLFSFVFCNIMSHNVDSRRLLATGIAQSLDLSGWLNYAEEQEGYAPLEIHRAIQRKDLSAVTYRLWQMLRGFCSMKGFRFFASGSMAPLLEALGLRTVSCQSEEWNGIPFVERISLVREGRPLGPEPEGTDPDYLDLRDEFQQMRGRFRALISGRPEAGFSAHQREEIEEEAGASANRYGPFLTLLSMADLVLPSLDEDDRGRLQAQPEPNWSLLQDLDGRFIGQMRQRAGLEEGPIDD